MGTWVIWQAIKTFVSAYWLPLLLAAGIAGAAGYFHHEGAVSQKAKDDKTIRKLEIRADASDANSAKWAVAVADMRQAAEQRKAADDAVQAQNAKALAEHVKAEQAARAALSAAQGRLRKALQGQQCTDTPFPAGVL